MTNRSTWIARGARAGILLGLAVGLAATVAEAKPGPEKPRSRRGFNLLASAELPMTVNNVFCGINNLGEVCVALAGSAVSGGGVWPKGTPDQYIFNSGLQVAATIPINQGPPEWAGDTVGAYFMDPRGTQAQGEGLTPVYNSLDPADAAAWPNGGIARDPALYNPILLGRNIVSQQDIWTRTWDGNPSLLSGRTHPMGVAVDIRGMGWNYPSGNEDNLYFIYTFYNVTASDPARYNTLDPAIRSEIAAIGQKFSDGVKARLNVTVPAAGYRFDNLYAAFFMDPDVGDATANYSTAILPFNLGIAYKSDFREADWQFPANIFGAPFAPAPGFVGVKYLLSPRDASNNEVGLTMFSNTLNSATGFPDPVGVIQLWRYLSGNVSASKGDNPCTFPNPKERKLCYLYQQPEDTRFFQASGPFTLDPGKSATIVVAYVHGAPVAKWITNRIGDDAINAPGTPSNGVELLADPTTVRGIDSLAGWVSMADANANGSIEQDEVNVTPRSLLDKSLVAQAVFDNKFLLPFSPDAPTFHLIPGDNEVSIVWAKSVTETAGDPYFGVASDSTNAALYDPNFRRFDVEGYRIYRGRTTGQLEMIAQFDYSGTTFRDVTGNLVYPNRCAPELGLDAAADLTNPTGCPVDFGAGETNTVDIVNPFVQVKNGDRVQLVDSTVLTLRSDTAVTGGHSGFPELDNSGVPFAFIDHGVRNSFTYYYAVTAFDVNSLKSGPSSLESAKITKSVTPRSPAPNQTDAVLVSGLVGDDGVLLDPLASFTIGSATGRFSGPPPATNALTGAFAPLVPALLPTLTLTATIDSVKPQNDGGPPGANCAAGVRANLQGICHQFFVTFDKNGVKTSSSTVVLWPTLGTALAGSGENNVASSGLGNASVAADPAASARFGVPAGFSNFNATVSATFRRDIDNSAHENQAGRRLQAFISPGGSRWFSGTNETVDHPTVGVRVGRLTGVDTIFSPLSHIDNDPSVAGTQNYTPAFNALESNGNVLNTNMQCHRYAVAAYGRQADVELTWGAAGAIASVRDITHHVNVPFKATAQSSYGFFVDANANGKIDWRDFDRVDGVKQQIDNIGFCGLTGATPGATSVGAPARLLVATPTLTAVSVAGSSPTASEAGFVTTGTGFGLYINGHPFIFQIAAGAAPASFPAAGTKWTLRSYAGLVTATNPSTLTPSGYTYSQAVRSPAVANLKVQFKVESATKLAEETDSTIALVHTVPDPYYVTTSLEATTNTKILKFVNLPQRAIIRIYSVSGVLIQVLTHNDQNFGGEETWNLRTRNNQFVASGVYFYHVESASGKTKTGRLTVVNFAQ